MGHRHLVPVGGVPGGAVEAAAGLGLMALMGDEPCPKIGLRVGHNPLADLVPGRALALCPPSPERMDGDTQYLRDPAGTEAA